MMVLLFGVLLVVSGFFLLKNQTPVDTGSQPSEINFKETGRLINWDSASGKHTNKWQLVYEKPGAPALKVNLVFKDESLSAELDDEDNGRRTYVEGVKVGDQVTVHKLIFKSKGNNP
jgi:hypothetical protein